MSLCGAIQEWIVPLLCSGAKIGLNSQNIYAYKMDFLSLTLFKALYALVDMCAG